MVILLRYERDASDVWARQTIQYRLFERDAFPLRLRRLSLWFCAFLLLYRPSIVKECERNIHHFLRSMSHHTRARLGEFSDACRLHVVPAHYLFERRPLRLRNGERHPLL